MGGRRLEMYPMLRNMPAGIINRALIACWTRKRSNIAWQLNQEYETIICIQHGTCGISIPTFNNHKCTKPNVRGFRSTCHFIPTRHHYRWDLYKDQRAPTRTYICGYSKNKKICPNAYLINFDYYMRTRAIFFCGAKCTIKTVLTAKTRAESRAFSEARQSIHSAIYIRTYNYKVKVL